MGGLTRGGEENNKWIQKVIDGQITKLFSLRLYFLRRADDFIEKEKNLLFGITIVVMVGRRSGCGLIDVYFFGSS